MAAAGDFLEYATVFGNKYGTPRAPVMAALEAGKDVLFDIDWQGTQQLKQQARDDLASVFVCRLPSGIGTAAPNPGAGFRIRGARTHGQGQ